MGLLSDRRRMTGGKAVPYDAEVEYLETTVESGFAYIDTGYVPHGRDIDIYMTFRFNGYSNNTNYIAWFNSTGTSPFRIARESGDVSVNVHLGHSWGARGVTSVEVGTRYEIEMLHTLTACFNGKEIVLGNPTIAENDDNGAICIFSIPSGVSQDAYTLGRLYGFKVVKGDRVVIDLVPVRKDGVGYMYDRVSGRLFGNANAESGSWFVVGPDKAYDAEVEYLEGTAEAGFIDTGYVVTDFDNEFYIDVNCVEYFTDGAWISWFAAWSGEDCDCYRITRYGTNGNKVSIWTGTRSQGGGFYTACQENVRHEIIFNSERVIIDGVLIGNISSPLRGKPNTGTLKIFSVAARLRVYAFKLTKGGKCVFDMIPVRKNGVGYLYNKVDGELYGNSGDGKFIVGPDI